MPEAQPYTVDDIIMEGGFPGRVALGGLFARLSSKKTLILQGFPGTEKTWLAKALLGRKSPLPSQLRSVQVHPSLSYEEFVRGNLRVAQAVRAHANFAEHAPLALLLLAPLEISGTPI